MHVREVLILQHSILTLNSLLLFFPSNVKNGWGWPCCACASSPVLPPLRNALVACTGCESESCPVWFYTWASSLFYRVPARLKSFSKSLRYLQLEALNEHPDLVNGVLNAMDSLEDLWTVYLQGLVESMSNRTISDACYNSTMAIYYMYT